MTVWLKLSENDLQLSAVFVVTVFFQGKRSRRDLKFSTVMANHIQSKACVPSWETEENCSCRIELPNKIVSAFEALCDFFSVLAIYFQMHLFSILAALVPRMQNQRTA